MHQLKKKLELQIVRIDRVCTTVQIGKTYELHVSGSKCGREQADWLGMYDEGSEICATNIMNLVRILGSFAKSEIKLFCNINWHKKNHTLSLKARDKWKML